MGRLIHSSRKPKTAGPVLSRIKGKEGIELRDALALSMPMPKAMVATTTGMIPADQSRKTWPLTASLSPAWYALASTPA